MRDEGGGLVHRRAFFKAAGLATIAGAVATTLPYTPAAADPRTAMFPSWVPEIFEPVPDAPEHTPAIVIGSGFGAAVTALRLAQAGVVNTVLERGSRWPNDPWREIFTGDDLPDGRGFWHRTNFTGVTKVPMSFGAFGGVLDVTEYPGIDVWRAAAVGGGSVIFTGAMVAPPRELFDQVFGGLVDFGELERVYYPRVRQMLRLDTMPADIYNSSPFTHSRAWDDQVRAAGYRPVPNDSIFTWDVLRGELAGTSRPSATVARSNLGNSNGAKFDLNQNYLRYAGETGKSRVYPGHRVDSIAQESGGRFVVSVTKLDPTGRTLGTRTLTCDQLFLGAGSVGTSELLVRAQATGALPNLNEHIGAGWGTNGDVVLARGASSLAGHGQGVPSASRIYDDSAVPLTLENWYIPGIPFETGALASLGMVLDPTRARFDYHRSGEVGLTWSAGTQRAVVDAARAVDRRIAEGAGALAEYGALGYDANADFTAHPLGGAVLGKATDAFGRVHGHPGLYVMDGAAIPGSTATVNPSLTITALAERNIEAILRG
ncbi:GMC oxidoreductase [Nocardia halotolerans]|uniref:Cholesterol oxidase n=1 Tax=Nocardia halotolerans TaxID=1755878 RepID=A0ABV8VN46_9NOCA